MNGYPVLKSGFRKTLAVFILLLFFAAGCGGGKKIKSYAVDVRVLPAAPGKRPLRARLVLSAADALKNPNLSRIDGYILREKTPLTTVLLKAVAGRMRAAGIMPLEEKVALLRPSGRRTDPAGVEARETELACERRRPRRALRQERPPHRQVGANRKRRPSGLQAVRRRRRSGDGQGHLPGAQQTSLEPNCIKPPQNPSGS